MITPVYSVRCTFRVSTLLVTLQQKCTDRYIVECTYYGFIQSVYAAIIFITLGKCCVVLRFEKIELQIKNQCTLKLVETVE